MLKNNKEIKRLKDVSLSEKDVMKICKGRANFIPYDQLQYVDNINQLLDPYGSCIILYLTKPSYGHFTALNLVGPKQDTLEAYDSYGYIPDDELSDFSIEPSLRKQLGEDYPYLLQLMYDSPYNLSFNEHKLQSKKSDVKTCGRWAGMRTLLKHLPLDDFVDLFKNNKLGSPDDIVCALTDDIG
jgi:hypothetical protein